MAKSVGMVCFVAATLFSGCCSAQTIVGPSGKPLQHHSAKCSQSREGCYAQATRDCGGGSYQILDSESHAGGLLADLIPGPVTWYGMTYTCGLTDASLTSRSKDRIINRRRYKPARSLEIRLAVWETKKAATLRGNATVKPRTNYSGE